VADRLGQQFGNYQLSSLLGQGGYAEVYLGQHVRLDLQAAIKVLHTHLTQSEAAHFQQEAQTIAKLAHPSIIRVFDFDVQDGTPFLVMDFAPNGSLRQRYPRGSPVPLPQIISYVKQVSAALQYAHDKKFIHRDVKPENMLIGQHQEVLLSDFGIATIAHSTSSLNVGTEGASGTLAYMAPEQIEGRPRSASDQYALGIVVYEWLCGERPFEGSASEVMAQHLSVPPPSLHERVPEIPPEVEQVVLRALAKDPKERFASVKDFAEALEQASQRALAPTGQLGSSQSALSPAAATSYETVAVAPDQLVLPMETTPSAELPARALESTVYPDSLAPQGLDTPPSEPPQQKPLLAPTAAVVSPSLEPTMPAQPKAQGISRTKVGLLIGLAVLVVAGGMLGSLSLFAHFGVLGAHSGSTTAVVRGGTWTSDFWVDPQSLLPAAPNLAMIENALYLPLFYGDAQGIIHPGAATEVPTVGNGGVNANATTWTFHLRPHLVWSDGQPYDARDVDFTWQLLRNPKFVGSFGLTPLPAWTLISRASVSADHLSITFHLTRPFAPFLAAEWVDGYGAPLPAHYFRRMPPEQILKSPDNLNPRVTSGPFMMAESVPGDHYTLVRNPRYYRAREGLPYLDKLVFRIVDVDTTLQDLQAGTITSASELDVTKVPAYQRLTHYTLLTPPSSASYEALFFNLHNTLLAGHPEVRQAMAMAIDHQALITQAMHGFATPLCTDHPSALHPGYQPDAFCPPFDAVAANKLLDDNGWVKGEDGVRTRGKERLEFEYSSTTSTSHAWRSEDEGIIQSDFGQIGIKLDIQNYPDDKLFGVLLPGGKASPPTGAVGGRYDIAEWENDYGYYDPDDSWLLSCGQNVSFYCNHHLDTLYQQELEAADPGVRQQIFQQIHQIYLTDYPFITLFSVKWPSIVRKGTHNAQFSPFADGINIWEWWCDNGKC
jgi:ABC-type transport system substrate-binding protein/serine/threonine protein kinase